MRSIMAVVTVLALSAFLATPAHAFKIGGHLAAGSGDAQDFDAEVDYLQLGFSMDTGRPGRLFHYRLHAGYLDLDYEGGAEQDGLGFDNHFGFAFNPHSDVRVWLGPTISVGFTSGDIGDGFHFGLGPTLGVDIPVGDSTLGLELTYRANWHSFSDEEEGVTMLTDEETFDDVMLRAVFLF